jgi:hypothetical protein
VRVQGGKEFDVILDYRLKVEGTQVRSPLVVFLVHLVSRYHHGGVHALEETYSSVRNS